MSYCDHLVWLDLETTGTDEVSDRIIQIGMAVTIPELPFAERNRFESLVLPEWGPRDGKNWKDDLHPKVTEMHTANGLFDAVDEAIRVGECPAPGAVTEAAITFLAPYGKRLLLAGSGVGHFDRRFLRRWMPELEARFLYPVLDVGVLRRTMHLIGRDDLIPASGDADIKNHTGLDDALLHLDEFRHYAGLFVDVPTAIEEKA